MPEESATPNLEQRTRRAVDALNCRDWEAVATWANGLIERITVHTDIDEACAAAERLAEGRG
jgi:hypothetical protein